MKLVPFQKCACGAQVVNHFATNTLFAESVHTVTEYRTVSAANQDGRGMAIVHGVKDCVIYRDKWSTPGIKPAVRYIDRSESIVTGQVEELSHD